MIFDKIKGTFKETFSYYGEKEGDGMAMGSDERDILEVFLILNLSNIAQNSPYVFAPLGLQSFIDTVTIDNVRNLNFPSDLRDLLVNYILVDQINSQRSIQPLFSAN